MAGGRLTTDPFGGLTAKEIEVLTLTSEGLTNATMAERLGLSVHAVKFHLASIFRKLGVKNRTEAAVIFSVHLGIPEGGQKGSFQ